MTADAAARLGRLATALREQRPVPMEDAELVADGIERFLDGGSGLEAELGLSARGQSWRLELACARRDEILREAARLAPAGVVCIEARAGWLSKELGRYYGIGWQRDRSKVSSPYPAGKLKHFLWSALKARDHPLGRTAMKAVLRQ